MEQTIHTDILIAGAGAAGIAAAVAAAGLGMKVVVVEKNHFPGGRATASAVGTICGLYYRSQNATPEYVMSGFPKAFGERLISISKKQPMRFSEGLWFIPCLPDDFEKTALHFLDHENITVLYDTNVLTVNSNAEKIASVTCIKSGQQINMVADAFVDCSGIGILCKLINHSVIKDAEYQAAAIVFSLDQVSFNDEFQMGFVMMKELLKHIASGNNTQIVGIQH